MSKLFISHNSADNEITQYVFDALEEEGHHSVYLDFDPQEGIPAGRDWEQDLYRELRSCQAMIVLCSENSSNSKWCFAEITHAKALGKPVFPIIVSACEVSPLLNRLQIIDLIQEPEVGFQRLWSGLREAGIDPNDSFEWDSSRSPFPGLTAFGEEDAAVFFGRDVQIQYGLELLKRMRRYGTRQAALFVGPSGIGKSSLIRAGIVPRLRRDPERWIIVGPLRPGSRPQYNFARALGATFESMDLEFDWRQFETSIAKLHGEQLLEATYTVLDQLRSVRRADATVLIIVDQAEDLSLASSEDAFIRLLAAGFGLMESCVLLFAVRTDQLQTFQRHSVLGRVTTEDLRIGPLSDDELRLAIEGPAMLAGIELEDSLASVLVEEADSTDALPLLAFSLAQLNQRFSEDKKLELTEYRDQMGGLSGVIERSAELLLDAVNLNEEDMVQVREGFLQLAGIDEQGEYIRRTAKLEDLDPNGLGIFQRFADQHLLVIEDTEEGQTVEAAHLALLKSWPRLRGWLDREREYLLWQRRFSGKLAEWIESGESDTTRLRGVALTEASDWLARSSSQLSRDERRYIEESVQANRRSRLRKIGLDVGIGLVVVALAAAGLWLQRSIESTRIAMESRDRTFLEVLQKSDVFPLESVVDAGTQPGGLRHDDNWVPLVGLGDQSFIIARPYGNTTPGRILATGHDTLDFANTPFARTALTWLQGNGEARIGISSNHEETISFFPNSYGVLVEDAMVNAFKKIGFQVRFIDDFSHQSSVEGFSVVVIGNSWKGYSSTEMEVIEQFVTDGGGLFVTGLGWSWQLYGPSFRPLKQNAELLMIEDYPMNALMSRYGMGWTSDVINVPARGTRPEVIRSIEEHLNVIENKLRSLR